MSVNSNLRRRVIEAVIEIHGLDPAFAEHKELVVQTWQQQAAKAPFSLRMLDGLFFRPIAVYRGRLHTYIRFFQAIPVIGKIWQQWILALIGLGLNAN